MKPRSRPPQKKIRIFYAPRFFNGQNRIKCAQITRANTVFINDPECFGGPPSSGITWIHTERIIDYGF